MVEKRVLRKRDVTATLRGHIETIDASTAHSQRAITAAAPAKASVARLLATNH
jgi:hypothetical protein